MEAHQKKKKEKIACGCLRDESQCVGQYVMGWGKVTLELLM